MMMFTRALILFALTVTCAVAVHAQEDATWTSYQLWDAGEKVQAVAVGDADHTRPGIEAAGVTADGRVGIGGLSKQTPWSEQIFAHSAKLYSVFISDVDPSIPGAELYVGGVGSKTRGEVIQLTKTKTGWNARTIWAGDGIVHAMARMQPARRGEPAELVVPTYSGKLFLLRPTKSALWTAKLVHQEALEGDSSRLLLKDVLTGGVGGLRGRNIFFSTKAGRAVLIDVDRPGSAKLIHQEAGGIARLSMDPKGVVYGSCNNGNVLCFERKGSSWNIDTLYHDVDELRGVRAGALKLGKGKSPVAIYGYSGHVRALVPGKTGWTSVSLFKDSDKSHSLVGADIVKGNGSEELVIGGYSGKMVLIARR